MTKRDDYPEVYELGEFLDFFNKETDRGAVLVAASHLAPGSFPLLGPGESRRCKQKNVAMWMI